MTWLVVGLIQQEDNWTGTDPLRTGFHRFTEIGLMFIINSLCENTLQRTMAGVESSHTPWVCLFSVAYDPYSGYIKEACFKEHMKLPLLTASRLRIYLIK